MNERVHRPVMVEEVLARLVTRTDGVYIDGTVGAGGHAAAVLSRLGPKGRVLGIDRDPQILEETSRRLGGDPRVLLLEGSFEDLDRACKVLGVAQVDGVFLDLGVSSLQLDEAGRGFSFSKEAPLDMRMNPSEGVDAAAMIARTSEREMERILREYGEEPFAGRIARRIVEARRRAPIEATIQLADLVARVIPRRAWPKRIHPATRTFQALRIAVNEELERLERFLSEAPAYLKSGGRLAVISYHSLEDRRVKQSFAEGERKGVLRRLTKKTVVPTEGEIRENPRARSAKLRVAEKTEAAS